MRAANISAIKIWNIMRDAFNSFIYIGDAAFMFGTPKVMKCSDPDISKRQ
ncbi:hypothetical protein METHPM2_1090003 [Pseudomonas sp. PM2]